MAAKWSPKCNEKAVKLTWDVGSGSYAKWPQNWDDLWQWNERKGVSDAKGEKFKTSCHRERNDVILFTESGRSQRRYVIVKWTWRGAITWIARFSTRILTASWIIERWPCWARGARYDLWERDKRCGGDEGGCEESNTICESGMSSGVLIGWNVRNCRLFLTVEWRMGWLWVKLTGGEDN